MFLKLMREGLGRIIIFLDFITRPKQVKRSEEEQAIVDKQSENLSLYQFYACPFCTRTRRVIRQLNLPIEYRDAVKGSEHRETLLAEGGEVKVPCLRIQEDGKTTWMYESVKIMEYLQKRFG